MACGSVKKRNGLHDADSSIIIERNRPAGNI